MYTDLSTFESQKGGNFGGGYSLLFCPREYLSKPISDYINPSSGLITEDFLDHIIAPTNLQTFFRPILNHESLQYLEKQTSADSGSYISVQIKARVLKDNWANIKSIESMRFHEYVVFYQGQNYEEHYWKVIGDKEKGMSFSSEFDSGEGIKTSAGWNITFALNSRYAPLIGHFPSL